MVLVADAGSISEPGSSLGEAGVGEDSQGPSYQDVRRAETG